MKELTFAEFCEIPLQYCGGIVTDRDARRMHRNEEFGIQREVHTKRKRRNDPYAGWKEGVVAFFLDGDDREFQTIDQVYVAYMEKVCQIKSS